MTTIFRHLAILLSCTLASSAAAEGFEPIDVLEARIVATLGAPVGVPGGPATGLDRRLKLAACPEAPEIAVPTPASAIVRCAALGWRIYVPLERRQAASTGPGEQATPLVHRGDQVEVVATGPGFTVTTFAEAEQEGAAGERIRVRLKPGLGPLVGEVIGSGRVSIAGLN
jgi:flagella basal body P-ring formation protein FlgA